MYSRDFELDDLHGYLTGSGNFREAIAVTAPYKGNRTGKKPVHYQFLRDYLIEDWGFDLIHGMEADDAIAMRATELGDKAVMVTIDKDIDQVPGWHYNFVKRKLYYVNALEGTRSFYSQILTGDRVDNIIGLTGIGPKRSAALLAGYTREQDFYKVCLEQYRGDIGRVLENASLLYLKRHPDDVWKPPIGD